MSEENYIVSRNRQHKGTSLVCYLHSLTHSLLLYKTNSFSKMSNGPDIFYERNVLAAEDVYLHSSTHVHHDQGRPPKLLQPRVQATLLKCWGALVEIRQLWKTFQTNPHKYWANKILSLVSQSPHWQQFQQGQGLYTVGRSRKEF